MKVQPHHLERAAACTCMFGEVARCDGSSKMSRARSASLMHCAAGLSRLNSAEGSNPGCRRQNQGESGARRRPGAKGLNIWSRKFAQAAPA